MTPLDTELVRHSFETRQDDSTEGASLNFELDDDTDTQSTIYTSQLEEQPVPSRRGSGAEMEEWRIMLLGRRGVGKSSTGNTILGQLAFPVDKSLSRTTQFCDRKNGTVDGRPVAVIDTPGLKNVKGDEKKFIREILKSISFYKPGPHIFLIVLPIANLTQDDINVHKIIERFFGKKVWWYTILLFTHGDSIEGTAHCDVISSADKELRGFIRKCSGGFVVFDNLDMTNRAQVTLLMGKIKSLMAVNGNKFYRAAFYPCCERRIRERQQKHMEERAEDIAQKERELETLYSGDELEKKRLEMWRSTDEELRRLSERLLKNGENKIQNRPSLKRREKECESS